MKLSLNELVHEFIDENSLRFEGEDGIESLNEVTEAIGYKGHGFAHGSPLEEFLADNPGACDAIIEWICKQNFTNWKEQILA